MTDVGRGDGVVVRGPGEGPATWAMGSLFEHLVSAGETDDLLGVSLVTQPPGVATPLHRHTREAESFFVLEGELRYRAGDGTYGSARAASSICRAPCRTRSGSWGRPRPASSRSRCPAG